MRCCCSTEESQINCSGLQLMPCGGLKYERPRELAILEEMLRGCPYRLGSSETTVVALLSLELLYIIRYSYRSLARQTPALYNHHYSRVQAPL